MEDYYTICWESEECDEVSCHAIAWMKKETADQMVETLNKMYPNQKHWAVKVER